MTRVPRPGAVGAAIVRGTKDVVVVGLAGSGSGDFSCVSVEPVDGYRLHSAVEAFRPFVVLDPHDGAQVQRFADLCGKVTGGGWALDGEDVEVLKAAFRLFVATPTHVNPPEPTGLGAVVVDTDDVTWTRASWRSTDHPGGDADPLPGWRAVNGPDVGNWAPYDRIYVVRVESLGWTPSNGDQR